MSFKFTGLQADTLYIKPIKELPDDVNEEEVFDINIHSLTQLLSKVRVNLPEGKDSPLSSLIGTYIEIGFSVKISISVAFLPITTGTSGTRYARIVE